MYDIDEPVLADPPVEPGYVCFWTSKGKFINEKITIERVVFDGVAKQFNKEPECFEPGTLSLILKPGTYKFTADKGGNNLDGLIWVKSGQCLKYRLE